jgi:hypothetical protein
MIFALVLLKLEVLVKIGSVIFLVSYILANSAVILFRESKIASYQPSFRAPLYPYTQIAGIVITGFLLLEVSTGILFLTLLFVCVSALIYRCTVYNKIVRDSALEHLLKRLLAADKELTELDVSTELKQIALSRDSMVEDAYYRKRQSDVFNEILQNSSVLDLDENLKAEPFFRRVSDAIAKDGDVNKLELLRKFMERELLSSTVCQNIAIPTCLVESKKYYQGYICREKKETGIS